MTETTHQIQQQQQQKQQQQKEGPQHYPQNGTKKSKNQYLPFQKQATNTDRNPGKGDDTSCTTLTVLPPLPEPMAKALPRLYNEMLVPLDLGFGAVRQEDYSLPMASAHHKALQYAHFVGEAKASVCFVVRRPGCVLCAEQGKELAELISSFPQNQVSAFAVVKEVGVDDEGLLSLYQNHFRFPFFLDSKRQLYKALGNRKIDMSNPFKVLGLIRKTKKRLRQKKIEGSMFGKGEGLTLGGILLLNQRGEIMYAHQEESCKELPLEAFRTALQLVLESDL